MIETLLGGVFGGLLRLAPEGLKLFDRAGERKHELAMLNAEMDFARLRGEQEMHRTEAVMTAKELDTIGKAFNEQSRTAAKAGKIVSATSALVRPLITYAFVTAYFTVKVAAFLIAREQGGEWAEIITRLWTADDVTILFMIISFWFVGRVWDRQRQ